MIRCPNCGTINRDGRRSCRECGSALPQTKLRCPECGTLNPVGNLFCDNCDTGLISPEKVVPSEVEGEEESVAPPVKGISLPTRAIEDDDDEEAALPDWLLGLADQEMTGPVSEAEPQSVEAGAEDEGGYPEWLSGLVDEEAFNGEEPEASPDADAFSLEDEHLPDWRREVEEPKQRPQRPEPQEACR